MSFWLFCSPPAPPAFVDAERTARASLAGSVVLAAFAPCCAALDLLHHLADLVTLARRAARQPAPRGAAAVSYTHLTLPTICSV
eukprot:485428-Prymnesium_polylepis.1